MKMTNKKLALWAGVSVWLAFLSAAWTTKGFSQVPIVSQYLSASGLPSSVTSTLAGYVGWGKNGTGDMDFIAANNGTSPSFYWYYLIGSSQTAEMWLDQSALLHVPGGVAGSLTGNASTATALAATPASCSAGLFVTGITANGTPGCSGALTGSLVGNASTATNVAYSGLTGSVPTWNQSTTGNAATATALAATPGTCAFETFAFGISPNGTPGCATPVYGRATSVNSTAGTAYATATTNVPLFQNGSGGGPASVTMPDANYAASCSIISPTGVPSIMGISKSTTAVTVTIVNGGTSGAEVPSGGAGIDCTIAGS